MSFPLVLCFTSILIFFCLCNYSEILSCSNIFSSWQFHYYYTIFLLRVYCFLQTPMVSIRVYTTHVLLFTSDKKVNENIPKNIPFPHSHTVITPCVCVCAQTDRQLYVCVCVYIYMCVYIYICVCISPAQAQSRGFLNCSMAMPEYSEPIK